MLLEVLNLFYEFLVFILVFFGDFLNFFVVLFNDFLGFFLVFFDDFSSFFMVFLVDFLGDIPDLVDMRVPNLSDCGVVLRVLCGLGSVELVDDRPHQFCVADSACTVEDHWSFDSDFIRL